MILKSNLHKLSDLHTNNLYNKILIKFRIEIPIIYLENDNNIIFYYDELFNRRVFLIGNLKEFFPNTIFKLLASRNKYKIQLALNLL